MTDVGSGLARTGRRRSERRPGTAEDGVFVPSEPLLATPGSGLAGYPPIRGLLSLEDPQEFVSPDEDRTYQHLTGLLLDSGISGVIRKEYVYLSSSLNGELVDNGIAYDFTVSDTFISFVSRPTDRAGQAEAFIETDGEQLESSQIRDLFLQVKRELLFREAWWLGSTSGSATFGIIELTTEDDATIITLPVETRFGEWEIEIKAPHGAESYGYSVVDEDRAIILTRRTADAVLSDIAEICGEAPDPAEVLEAMVKVASTVGASAAN